MPADDVGNIFAELNLAVWNRIAKLPNLIPRQFFRLYGVVGLSIQMYTALPYGSLVPVTIATGITTHAYY